MLYPDPTHRGVWGWPIRWIAGLLLFLIVAAGAIPTYASDASDPGLDGRAGSIFAMDGQGLANAELQASTSELLGSKSAADAEAEAEKEADSPAWWAASALLPILTHALDGTFEASSARSCEASGQRSSRAPPFA